MKRDKRILIFGLGVSGLGLANFLKKENIPFYWKDDRNADSLLGGPIKDEDRFQGDLSLVEKIVKSEGIRNDNSFIAESERLGVPVISSLDIFAEYVESERIIGITGTNGKTTSTHFIAHTLKEAGFKAIACGNVGCSVFEHAGDRDVDFFVVELSSFQLDRQKKFHPHVAIILNISPDHIDWHGTFDNYIGAKLNISKNMDCEDYLILNSNDANISRIKSNAQICGVWGPFDGSSPKYAHLCDNKIYIRDGDEDIFVIDKSEINIPGLHNIENLMAGSLAAYVSGVKIENIRKSTISFKGVKHRIQLINTVDGVKYYNDSKGTNPDATIKAVQALGSGINLILGGYDKKVSFEELFNECKGRVENIAVMGEVAEELENLAKSMSFKVKRVNDLNEAVEYLRSTAKDGESVLLSPACASWDMYDNYEQRGDHFIKIVNKLVN